MPDFKTHISWGLFSYPVYIFVALLVAEVLGFPLLVDTRVIGTGYFLYILGSDFPDIDSKQALIKRILEVLIAAIVSFISYSSLISPRIQPVLLSWIYFLPLVVAICFSIAIFLGVMTSRILEALSHRGFFHTLWAGLLYGLAIAALLIPGSQIANGDHTYSEVAYLSFAGISGYFLHLILDSLYTSKKKRKRALSKKSSEQTTV